MTGPVFVPGLLATAVCAAACGMLQGGGDSSAYVPDLASLAKANSSELRDQVERYSSDRGALQRRHDEEYSPDHRAGMKAFYEAWRSRLASVDFDALGLEGRIDHVLLGNRIEYEMHELALREGRLAEAGPLIPFAATILDLHDKRRRMDPVEPEEAAAALSRLAKDVEDTRKAVEAGAKSAPDAGAKTAPDTDAKRAPDAGKGGVEPIRTTKSIALRTAGIVDSLKSTLSDWFHFYDGYDPVFTWWAQAPYKKADEALKAYAKALREQVVGFKEGEDEPIVGDPIGRDALLAELRLEMIAYTPEELVAIAERELAWCDQEMLAAAREMGCGDDWKKALEKVKSDHVEPGRQTALILELANEAVAFLDQHDLVTVPPLAREVWRMEMLSPEAQKTSPFFLGGEVIRVSFPTDTMAHEDKQMSMRGNNRHFARATVHHEVIPGHHLQGFMTARYNAHRRAFSTPFWGEGWAFYWETLLWDLGFPKTPEDRVGFLFWRMHRCARVIFSLGFHLGKMTPQECIDLLVDRVGHERANATAEVRRSFNGSYGPLYQLAYMMGALQFRALHHELVDSGKMTNRAFHDAILQGGTMPIEMVRARLVGEPLAKDHVPGWRFGGDPTSGDRR